MANICFNEFFASSDDEKNIEYLAKALEELLGADVYGVSNDCLDATFDSRWTFPEEIMNELFEGVPNKDDIYMRCLSVEYGCDYVAYHKCEDNEGWFQVV